MNLIPSIPESYRVNLTSPHPWNPSTVQLSSLDSETSYFDPQHVEERVRAVAELANDGDQVLLSSINSEIHDLKERLSSNVNISSCNNKRSIQ